MKRLSKTAWIVLGVGIFIIGFAALYMLYSQQDSEKQQLENNLVLAQAETITTATEKRNAENELTKVEGTLAQLESNLDQAILQLNGSKINFPNSVESIEYDERLFSIARSWGLVVSSLTASEPGQESVEDITFSITNFTVNVKGQVDDILGFVNTISIDPYFVSGTIRTVNLNVPGDIDVIENASATIALTIYGY